MYSGPDEEFGIERYKFYSVEQVAGSSMLDCSTTKIYELINRGYLKSLHLGTSHRIPGWSVIEMRRHYKKF
jgi:hypothetical protein